MPAPSFTMKQWNTGQRMTLLQAFGFSKAKFSFPELKPALPGPAGDALGKGPPTAGLGAAAAGAPLPSPKQTGALQQFARKLLAQEGWQGQFGDFNSLENSEASWNVHAKNPKSGAYGLGQALGHGNANTQGTESNMYGGFGLTDKQARAANSGNGFWQLVWMRNYIKTKYGSPRAAWQFHLANNWY